MEDIINIIFQSILIEDIIKGVFFFFFFLFFLFDFRYESNKIQTYVL